MELLHPFIPIPGYPFIVCKECQYACISSEVTIHLRRHHSQMPVRTRKFIAQQVQGMTEYIQTQEQLRQYQMPAFIEGSVPFIAAPRPDGIRCHACPYMVRQVQYMRQHCREQHGWTQEWNRAANFQGPSKTKQPVPWTTDIPCQRFFPSRAGSQWIEVRNPTSQAVNPLQNDEIAQIIQRVHEEAARKIRELDQAAHIREIDIKFEPNPWVSRTGWTDHLSGFEAMVLHELARVEEPEEGILRQMTASVSRIMEAGRAACHRRVVGLAALFMINRREVSKNATQPFTMQMEEDSWERYKDVWRKMMCIWGRTQQQEPDKRPPYQFTPTQEECWAELVQNAQVCHDMFEGQANEEAVGSEAAMDQACLAFIMAVLNHPIRDDEHKNAMVSALAVLGIREDGGWHDPCDYTPTLSAVVKGARMLAIYSAHQEEQEEMGLQRRVHGLSLIKAQAVVPGVYARVRRMVQKFMTRVGDGRSGYPGPMDYILETRTYGMHIRFNTTAGGSIVWNQDRVQFKRIGFSMAEVSDMMHAVVGEARALLVELTMGEEEAGVQALPMIPWDKLEDDNSENQVEYSFLSDTRNTWLQAGHGWCSKQIAQSAAMRKKWIAIEQGPDQPYHLSRVKAYRMQMERFREKLWLLMHLTSGQPARASEILGIQFRNGSANVRNVFIHKHQVCFVTAYHKNFNQTSQSKIIHRFMPRDVGELLGWYLWLVLPFWQQVQGITSGVMQKTNPFIWGIHTTQAKQAECEEDQTPRSVGSDGPSQEVRQAMEVWEKRRQMVWTSDRVRRVLQNHSERLMGCRVNISVWRHIAIAISNRYLGANAQGEEGMGGFEDEDDIDEAEDEQAGHGSHIAGIIYAREIQQGFGSTARRTERFRQVSRKWHRFFGFDRQDDAVCGQKRRRDGFQAEREDIRFQRMRALQQTNIVGQLQQMVGPGAQFRGQQASVIRSIMAGNTPIIQIASTGGGKSLSFMLPAFCSPQGTTIVIVPLVALQDDLYGRCMEAKIPAHIWKSRGPNPVASIVFVTPESATTNGFADFIHRLQDRQVLDRVVVDECHTLLDGSPSFRPKLSQVGEVIRSWGVQRVFLTATLGPDEMKAFAEVAAVPEGRSVVFRSKTTRPNIRYRVIRIQGQEKGTQGIAEDAQVCRIIEAWLRRSRQGKAIVYAGVVERVKTLGEQLGCQTYFNQVDSAQGKRERLATWMAGERVIVATNALGMGIDVPDVRLVVHAWMPRRIRDYVQESGRAGRNGQPSEAVVVCGWVGDDAEARARRPGRHEVKDERDPRTVTFVDKKQCRRIVLDMAMDGEFGRGGCEEGEELCDVCHDRRAVVAVDEPEDEANKEARRVIGKQDRAAAFQAWQNQQDVMAEAERADQLALQVEMWAAGCVVCRLMGEYEDPDSHSAAECPYRETPIVAKIQATGESITEAIFTKRQLAPYSGCFGCGLPQKVCRQWRPIDHDHGRYERIRGVVCQYPGVLVRFFSAMVHIYPQQLEGIMGEEWDISTFCRWGGKRIPRWGGMETNEMCRGFSMLCQWLNR